MRSLAKDVATYIQEAPSDRREALTMLRHLRRKVLKGLEERMAYGGRCYATNGTIEVGFASQKCYISLCIPRQDALETQRPFLKGLSVGKAAFDTRDPTGSTSPWSRGCSGPRAIPQARFAEARRSNLNARVRASVLRTCWARGAARARTATSDLPSSPGASPNGQATLDRCDVPHYDPSGSFLQRLHAQLDSPPAWPGAHSGRADAHGGSCGDLHSDHR